MATARAESSFFDQTDVEIPLSYDFLPDVEMKFFLRLQMSKEATEINQKHLGLEPSEREAKSHESNVAMLASLSTRLPEGVPTFPTEGDVQKSVREFFADKTEMKEKVCIDVLNRYFKRIQPKEYL